MRVAIETVLFSQATNHLLFLEPNSYDTDVLFSKNLKNLRETNHRGRENVFESNHSLLDWLSLRSKLTT